MTDSKTSGKTRKFPVSCENQWDLRAAFRNRLSSTCQFGRVNKRRSFRGQLTFRSLLDNGVSSAMSHYSDAEDSISTDEGLRKRRLWDPETESITSEIKELLDEDVNSLVSDG